MSEPKREFYDSERNLMITKPTQEGKWLHKVGTNEYYDSAIDVIEGYDGKGKPYCRFTYEEVDKPREEEENAV